MALAFGLNGIQRRGQTFLILFSRLTVYNVVVSHHSEFRKKDSLDLHRILPPLSITTVPCQFTSTTVICHVN